jgi:hypothetical protein
MGGGVRIGPDKYTKYMPVTWSLLRVTHRARSLVEHEKRLKAVEFKLAVRLGEKVW